MFQPDPLLAGTTIGYGDISPKSDVGKLAVAMYAVLAINVVASMLEPARDFLLEFCLVPEETDISKKAANQSTSDGKSDESSTTTNQISKPLDSDNVNENDTLTKSQKKQKSQKKSGNSNGTNATTAVKKDQ